MKRSLIFIIAMALMTPALAGAEAVKWMSLRDGMEKSKADNRPMIIDYFFGKGCPRCEFLQQKVYDDPAIAKKIMADFVPIRVDLTKKLTKEEEDLGNKYDFKSDCLLLFLSPKGEVISGPGGKRLCFMDKVDPEVFISYLDWVKEQVIKAK